MTSAALPTARDAPVPEARMSLRRLPVAWLDRVLPARPGPFLAVVGAVSVACWVAGLLLAHDRARFLANREWQVLPLYLAVHLVVVRLFVTAYAGEFLAGCRPLAMEPAEAEQRARRVLGPAGFAVALCVAAPLAAMDVLLIFRYDYVSAIYPRGAPVGAGDWLLAGVWTLEWIANAYVWVVIAGFLAASMHALGRHPFRDHVVKVLRERQYRPFLLMSGRGASIVVVFAMASALYVLYATGETSDYIGLWVTAGLLVAGFVPPWLRLRNRVSILVHDENERLGRAAEKSIVDGGGVTGELATPRTVEAIGERLQVVTAFLRIEHLERLHRDMGKIEAQQVLLRLLAPVATIAWRLVRG